MILYKISNVEYFFRAPGLGFFQQHSIFNDSTLTTNVIIFFFPLYAVPCKCTTPVICFCLYKNCQRKTLQNKTPFLHCANNCNKYFQLSCGRIIVFTRYRSQNYYNFIMVFNILAHFCISLLPSGFITINSL